MIIKNLTLCNKSLQKVVCVILTLERKFAIHIAVIFIIIIIVKDFTFVFMNHLINL